MHPSASLSQTRRRRYANQVSQARVHQQPGGDVEVPVQDRVAEEGARDDARDREEVWDGVDVLLGRQLLLDDLKALLRRVEARGAHRGEERAVSGEGARESWGASECIGGEDG